MSAFGGKADVREQPSECLLIARSGHLVFDDQHLQPLKRVLLYTIIVPRIGGASRPHFGNRNLTWNWTTRSDVPLGFSAFQKTCPLRSMGWLPSLINRPTPPPNGTFQRSSLSAAQLAEMVGVEVRYQPLSKL